MHTTLTHRLLASIRHELAALGRLLPFHGSPLHGRYLRAEAYLLARLERGDVDGCELLAAELGGEG